MWNKNDLDGFHRAAQSLKLYRRAELQDEESGTSLIDVLYVDPLPNDQVLQTMLKANTTLLIGRKGTGKSTIFQRTRHELQKRVTYLSAYLDIKTIFESAQIDQNLLIKIESISAALPRNELEKILLYKAFISAVILEIKEELRKRMEQSSTWAKIKESLSGALGELYRDLENLVKQMDDDQFISILGFKNVQVSEDQRQLSKTNMDISASAGLNQSPGIDASMKNGKTKEYEGQQRVEYTDILMRSFNIKNLLSNLNTLLKKANIHHLYIFIDDFSELPLEAMQIIVDTLLAPLNNWSNEMVKFKIAAYPGRVYYGTIDKTKNPVTRPTGGIFWYA